MKQAGNFEEVTCRELVCGSRMKFNALCGNGRRHRIYEKAHIDISGNQQHREEESFQFRVTGVR